MNVYLEAARPKTLTAAVVPVCVGTACASEVVWWRFGAGLVVALALQVAVNYANDYFDGIGGVDTEERLGPRRVVASGLIEPAAMKTAMFIALGVAAVTGIAVAAATSWWLLTLGAAAMAAAIAYSGGPKPYASAGLGEVFVFIFFGLAATIGSSWIHDQKITAFLIVAAVGVGLISVAVLVINNLRDIPTDRPTGKRTLAVLLGDRVTRYLFVGLLLGALGCAAIIAYLTSSLWPLLALVATIPAGRAIAITLGGAVGKDLIAVLGQTSATLAVYGVGLTCGVVLAL